MNCRLPQHLTLTSMPLAVAGQLRMAFTLSLGFALNDAEGRILPPNEAWDAAMNALSPEEIPDMGLPKPVAEWLLAGAACAPEGTTVTGLPVSIAVGSLTRQLLVSGDAEDDGVSLPVPRPFARMPLTWSRTHGGPEQADNPLGCGLVRENGLRRLPNVADRNTPGPACPGAQGLWPSRMQNLGTFDTPWLLTRWPGVPDDFDWSFYQLAQPCQRFSGYLRGGESLRITNMHTEHAVIEGRLPRLRARLFVEYGTEQQPDWREAAVNADTVWLFPNALAGLLFWHGTLPTVDERGTDIRQVVVALEACDAPPRSVEDCLASPDPVLVVAVAGPLAEVISPEPVSVDVPAPPPSPELPTIPEVPAMPELADLAEPPIPPKAALAAMIAEIKAELRQVLPGINATLQQQGLPQVSVEDVSAALDKQAESATTMLDIPEVDSATIMREAGFPDDYLQNVMEAGSLPMPEPGAFLSPEAYQKAAVEYADIVCAKLGAPASSREQMLAMLLPQRMQQAEAQVAEQIADMEKALGLGDVNKIKAALAAIPESSGDMASLAFLEQAEGILGLEKGSAARQFAEMLRTTRMNMYLPENLPLGAVLDKFPDQAAAFARLQQLVQQPPEGLFDLSSLAQSAGLHGDILSELASLDPFPMGDLADAVPDALPDIAQEALPDVDAFPDSADVDPVPELQPIFELPHDKDSLLAALAAGMPLEGQNLAGLDLAGISLTGFAVGGSLRGLLLDGACCVKADFSGCDLRGARFVGASFAGARLVGANLSNGIFACADFTGADLTGAVCDGADFTGAKLNNAILADLVCPNAEFSGACLDGSRWQGAQGKDMSFGSCTGVGVNFSRTQLPGCTFEGATLAQAVFADAALVSGTFQASTLSDCDFSRANLRNLRVYDARFVACCLADADMADSGWLRVTTEAFDARNATATGAVFEECGFITSDWACASARQARWLCCDLRGSRLDRLDLLDGALRGSRLGDASLAGANLFNADLYRMGVNAGTTLLGANLGNTCLTLSERE